MKATKRRKRNSFAMVELTPVGFEALVRLGERLYGGCGLSKSTTICHTADLLIQVALANLPQWIVAHDAIVRYCEAEGLDGVARTPVFDDRIKAAFENWSGKTIKARASR